MQLLFFKIKWLNTIKSCSLLDFQHHSMIINNQAKKNPFHTWSFQFLFVIICDFSFSTSNFLLILKTFMLLIFLQALITHSFSWICCFIHWFFFNIQFQKMQKMKFSSFLWFIIASDEWIEFQLNFIDNRQCENRTEDKKGIDKKQT